MFHGLRMLIETLGVIQTPQDFVDLACFHLANNSDLAHFRERVFLDIQPILTILKALFLPQPSTSIQEVPSWRNPSKCASPAPERAVLVLSGDLKSYAVKAKPIVRWGRKATDLNSSCWPCMRLTRL